MNSILVTESLIQLRINIKGTNVLIMSDTFCLFNIKFSYDFHNFH